MLDFSNHLFFHEACFFLIFFLLFWFNSADINECSEGTDDCNRKTQLCLNTRGSYKCQEKIVDKCLPGLKYNLETKLCEGGLAFDSFCAIFCLWPNWFSFVRWNSISDSPPIEFSSRFPLQTSTSAFSIPTRVTTGTSVSTPLGPSSACNSTKNPSMKNTLLLKKKLLLCCQIFKQPQA